MLAVDVLWHATEERQGDAGLDVVVSIDRRRHRLDNPLADAIVSGECSDGFLVILRQTERCEEILLLVDVVGLEDRREYRETVLDVKGGVKVVAIDTGDFLFSLAGTSAPVVV